MTTTTIIWTDAASGSSGHVGGRLVMQIRKLGVGGWSAGWRNGLTWDVSDQLKQVKRQASRHFRSRPQAKKAAQAQLDSTSSKGNDHGT